MTCVPPAEPMAIGKGLARQNSKWERMFSYHDVIPAFAGMTDHLLSRLNYAMKW